ncbi:MAG: hypothetical protein ABSG43_17315 [Solirubrobacteraceae bacterium]|jgi:threonine/homoserine/homoserine lactone efflux protein
MTALPAILAAAGVGLGHAILPDHWMPLAVVGRTQRYPVAKVARLSGLAGVAHVLVSIVLGAIVIVVGLQFRSSVEHAQDTIVGLVLIATGIGFACFELAGRGHSHSHSDHEHGHDHSHHVDGEHHAHSRGHGLLAIMIPFGAAASPDLTILPVFVAATTAGPAAAVGSLLVFAIVTIATIVSLTLFATVGGYQLRGRWLDRWGNGFSATVLVVIGALVLAGLL